MVLFLIEYMILQSNDNPFISCTKASLQALENPKAHLAKLFPTFAEVKKKQSCSQVKVTAGKDHLKFGERFDLIKNNPSKPLTASQQSYGTLTT